ncbi:RluA family pseudouridine synthase [Staphylococcus devriesei]|uniref:RNA pseudouridylate synthase n=1 Tax=Staphylococcus devriesei TaxID=586733 RepID=A0A2K4DL53_9STAP|nr:RluA family pseudouridine synthase [Staphylococcus devriesei]MCE5096430.1 RluA family pseudouridine synthase [Staphylococcus devriesei]PNZ87518.1 RluA family pseudouridine synthase [Staphylococcus devriesei]PTE73802.1 RluA family pseudouridine synthase [Staphylococcus devriesei]PTF02336.1 RluA family pseudouridine synthase [Staphylococcus devriesei]PTF11986.1 RluA family pseudouridine synthase [Staphylococcus devriesei]
MKFVYSIHQEEMLKLFLQRHNYSKKTVSAIKRNGALIINEKPVTVRKVMYPGDQLTISLPQEEPSTYLIPSDKKIEILYEDAYLIVVSKPSQLNSTPSREHPHDSLIERVLHYLNESHISNETVVPHIVTRLDRNTRGVVIFSKHGHIHHLMSTLEIDKRYMCVCFGRTQEEGTIEAPIAREDHSIITRKVASSGKYAKTGYKTVKANQNASLCEVKLYTGRTHQIRVHFSYIGHALVGDDLYQGYHPRIHTQSLQCYKVRFKHPIYNREIEITMDYKQLEAIYNQL